MLFSQRAGITPAQPPLQRETISDETRTRLWNALHLFYWRDAGNDTEYSELDTLFRRYWHHFFAWRLDRYPRPVHEIVGQLRREYEQFSWHRLLDFLEFTARHGPEKIAPNFRKFANNVFERDNAAYRFVGSEITEVTAAAEIESIENALSATASLPGINRHLTVALQHMSDRNSPDFRNSIKESISAVEATARLLTRAPKATLGNALSVIEDRGQLHGALKSSLSSLYGYTSDADGIRHAMLEEPQLTFTDAKFMLVACTAFVNYLLAKAAALGLSFDEASPAQASERQSAG